ncbi:MAG: sialidase family protein, partial [Longimonas sp.]|uniref:sialidase family protein n=1 Tax=Longimonas sp. TaxID=2039626 RepID=UPI003359DA24
MQYLSAMLIACAMLALGLGACSTPEAPGLTLLPAESPVAGDTFAPRLSVDADGHLLLSYLSKTDAGHALQFVRHDGSSWTAPRTVAEGDDWFANWADTPGVRPVGEWLFAHWLVRSGPAAYHYSIHAAWSVDGGVTWSDPFILHGEGRPAEHGFLSSVVLGDGALGVTWLDGRYTVDSEASHENAASHDAHAAHQGAMSLRWARFEPGETRPTRDIELDNQVCDCCMTASVREGSDVRVLYRDRTDAEIRDIASVRVTPSGQQHDGRVAADGWEIPACPVEGPAVARRGATTDAVWFTGSESMPKVFWAASSSDAEG